MPYRTAVCSTKLGIRCKVHYNSQNPMSQISGDAFVALVKQESAVLAVHSILNVLSFICFHSVFCFCYVLIQFM